MLTSRVSGRKPQRKFRELLRWLTWLCFFCFVVVLFLSVCVRVCLRASVSGVACRLMQSNCKNRKHMK